jgi:hypothetical protein
MYYGRAALLNFQICLFGLQVIEVLILVTKDIIRKQNARQRHELKIVILCSSFLFAVTALKSKAKLLFAFSGSSESTSILEIRRIVNFCFPQSDGPEWDISHNTCRKGLKLLKPGIKFRFSIDQ